jgi:hypothetical protein
MSNKPPIIEYATSKRSSDTAWRSLSQLTGLPIERVEQLAARNELAALFSPRTGRLRPATEIRSLEAAGRLQAHPSPTPQQRLVELNRHPPGGPVDGSN